MNCILIFKLFIFI